MTQKPFGPRWRAGLVAGALLLGAAGAARGQSQATITGRITSERGDPLVGARVSIDNTNFGTTTGTNGAYSLVVSAEHAKGQSATLRVRALGYKPAQLNVTVSPGMQEHNFTLANDPLHLDELVVTGVSEATSTKKLTFSVGKVSEEQLNVAPAVTALGALQGKVAGVSIMSANGDPGGAPQIQLRGATSITGTSDPLIIVDGTITHYSLADIASEDIERVEVVKGAAASSLYGSNGANGVIQIFTKRGANLADGKIQVTTRFEGGQSSVPGTYPTTQHTAFIENADGSFYRRDDSSRVLPSQCDPTSDTIQCPSNVVDIQNKPYPVYAHAQDKLLTPGNFFTQYASVGQRRGRTNFNASFQNTYNQGSVFNVNGFKRQNYRVNVDQVLSDNLDLSFNAFYGKSNNDEPASGTDDRFAGAEGNAFFGIAFLEPSVDPTAGTNPDGTPYRAFIQDKRSNARNPLYEIYNFKQTRTRGRFTGGGRLRWRPFSWLSAEGNYNYDQSNQEYIYQEPFQKWSPSSKFSSTPGGYSRSFRSNQAYNTGATVTGIWRVQGSGLFTNLGITAKGAWIYEDQQDHYLQSTATKFIVKQVPEFPGTDIANQTSTSNDQTIRNRDVFGIATLDFNDKVIMDGLIRRDGSSLFGPDSRYATYYRASGAIRLPQLMGWKGGPEEFRLRASYGTAGLRPPFEAQYEVLTPQGGSFVKTQLGNRNLKPAKSKELELGTNIELFSGRLTFEYNFSNKETRDQIILAPLPGTSGFQSQWQNIGSIQAKTHEIAVGAQVINSRNVALQMTLTGDRVREVITDWPLPPALYGPDGSFSPFQFAPGVRLGTMKGQKWVHTIDDLYRDPVKKAQNGAGQAWDPAAFTVNADGYVVRKSQRGTNDERPIALVDCVDAACTQTTNIFTIGVAAPDFRMGLNTTLALKRFAITTQLDWSQGGQIYNGTAHWGTQDCASIKCDQSSKAPADQIAEGFYSTGLYNGASANEAFVEDASFLKLRELSVNYTFNRNELSKIGLGKLFSEIRVGIIGRNLFTWSPYSGLDPDVAPVSELFGARTQGGTDGTTSAFRTRMDWFQYPQFRTFTAAIEIAF
jgi:TonB-linked SusC/RagA family outer membrane protein